MHKPSGRIRTTNRSRRRRSNRTVASFLARRTCGSPVVSVIIPAMNEERTIGHVIREAWKVHESCEVIVVANGCTDRTEEIAAAMGARVLHYDEPLGHDAGRAVGAAAAAGRALLFVDADIRIGGSDLKPFVSAVLNGTDVALNRYGGLGPPATPPSRRISQAYAEHVFGAPRFVRSLDDHRSACDQPQSRRLHRNKQSFRPPACPGDRRTEWP